MIDRLNGFTRAWRRHATIAIAALALPFALHAQGTLSTQGLGYPQGEFSTRALSTGGALGETDPTTPINPAAILGFGSSTLYFQYEPEYRDVNVGGQSQCTSTSRYPLMVAAVPMGEKWMLGFSSSMYLDRTWGTTRDTTEIVGADTVPFTTTHKSEGSIADLRFATAYEVNRFVRIGVGLHGFSGANRLSSSRVFADTTAFANHADTTNLSYRGTGVSGGIEFIVPELVTFAASARHGGVVKAEHNDTTFAQHARIPDEFGASLAFIGAANTTISARTSLIKWSSLSGLLSPGARPHDAWDSGIGADIGGPRFGNSAITLRTGYRWRTLPFDAAGTQVTEKSFSVGFGTFLARGHAVADVAAVRQMRDAGSLSERAWTISVGLSVHP